MEKISVQFLAPHVWRWALLVIPALIFSFWAYYRILAPLTRPTRLALWTLRGLAFLLVIMALSQPVMTAVLRDSGRPRLAVLVDRSASMSLPAGDEGPPATKEARARDVVREIADKLGGRFRLQWYGFADGVRSVQPDSILPAAGNTALGGALEAVLTQADSRPVSGAVVITDGVNTVGRDPAQVAAASPVPIFTVAVGPAHPPPDVEIRRVRTNPTAFVGEPLPIQAVVSNWGMGGRKARVEVRQGDRVLAGRDLELLGDQGLEQEVDLEVRPGAPGVALYDVVISGVRDSVPQNDRRQVAVDVLDRKTRVLVMAERLDWDFSFIRRTLGADTTLAYTFLVQARPGAWRALGEERLQQPPTSDAELRDFAAVVLLGYGEDGPAPATLDVLARFVRAGGGLFIAGGPARPEGWTTAGSFASILPGRIGPDLMPTAKMLPVQLTLEGQRHPATAVRDNPAEAAQLWASLPPLWRPGGSLVPSPEAKVLLEYRSGRGGALPALAVDFAERGKTAWLYGDGFWRWSFLSAGSPAPSDLYPSFLLGLVRWLAEPAVRERFQVAPTKGVYQNGESIAFSGSLWNSAYAPVSDARVTIEVRAASDSAGANPASRLDLRPGSDAGVYDGEGGTLPPGAYVYRAVARDASGVRELEHAQGRFWVETMGPEFARTWTDTEALTEIAKRSGGAEADPSGLAGLLESIPRSIRRMGRIKEIEVWNHWLLFLCFVSALSVEWFLRRRRGLA